MARKTLLTESEIRRFLKLASMPAVGDSRLQEMGSLHQEEDESLEEEVEDLQALEDEEPLGDEMADLPGEEIGGESEADALGDEMGAEEIGGTDEASVETLVQALVDTIADVTGVPVSMDSSGAEGGEEDVEADLDMGEPAELEGGDELGGDELGAVEDEPVPGGRDYMEEDQLVAEVARRVAARLAKKARKEQLADTLAERIMDRLTK